MFMQNIDKGLAVNYLATSFLAIITVATMILLRKPSQVIINRGINRCKRNILTVSASWIKQRFVGTNVRDVWFWIIILVNFSYHLMILILRSIGVRRSNDSFCLSNWSYPISNDLAPTRDYALIHKFLLDSLIFRWLYTVFTREKSRYHFCFRIHCMPLPLSCMRTRWRWKWPLKWFNHCLLSVSWVLSGLTSLYYGLVHTLCIHSRLRRIKSSDVRRPAHSQPFVLTIPYLPRPWSQSLHLSFIFFPKLCYCEAIDMFLELFFIIVSVSRSLCCFNMFELLGHSGAANLRTKRAIIFFLVAETLPHLFDPTLSLFVPL